METVRITHFSDLLCVWAYVSQIRCDELIEAFPGQVGLDCRYLHVFGDVAHKIETAWSKRGGVDAYSAHVREIVEGFGHVDVHPRVWTESTPTSSMPAHLLLSALRALESQGAVDAGTRTRTAWALRVAFFERAEDISDGAVLTRIASESGADEDAIQSALAAGRAHAELASDIEEAQRLMIRSSPTMLFNEGRQRLTGNVGYRIMEANVRELLERPAEQQSWC